MLRLSILKCNIIIRFVIVFSFTIGLTANSYSIDFCSDKENYRLNSVINNIDIKINKERNFIIQNGKKVINFYSNDYEKLKKKKKKFKSEIIVSYDQNLKCKLKAVIRSHGDQADHIKLINGIPVSSLRVKLNDGNINGITRFILFIPNSRYSDNEIFVTTLFRELNFLAPRTFYINSRIHNQEIKYLFQESLKKELLEYNNYVEGPIIEKKEDFFENPKILQMSKIANNEWIKSNNSNVKISLLATTKWNQILINSFKDKIKGKRDDIVRYNKDLLSDKEFNILSQFDALMFALDAHHGLSFDDRRFYLDPISKNLIPIYYDGMSKILSLINYNFKLDLYQKSISSSIKPSKIFFNEKDFDPDYRVPYITFPAILGAPEVIKKINNIKIEELQKKIEKNGIDKIYIDKIKLKTLLDLIVERLQKIQKAKIKEYDYKELNNPYTKYPMENMDNEKNLIFLDKILINKNSNKLQYKIEVCKKNILGCYFEVINFQKLENLLEGLKYNGEYAIFFGFNKKDFLNYKKNYSYLKENFTINDKNNIINLAHTKNVDIIYNKNLNILNLIFKDSTNRVIIYNSNLKSLKINMLLENSYKNIIDSKYEGLTGCLTILESNLDLVEIEANNFECEDTVNFIRSNGNLNTVKIANSHLDTLDADFSNLKFKQIIIDKSGNDCADFSYGNYYIEYAKLSNCGDKAISVGEKSNLNANSLEISYSLSGIVSKDSSSVEVKKSYIKNTETCYMVYKKKQEFNAAILTLNDESCFDYSLKFSRDAISQIVFK